MTAGGLVLEALAGLGSAMFRFLVAYMLAAYLTHTLLQVLPSAAPRFRDRAYVLEQGHVRYSGTIAELQAGEPVRQAYLLV